LPTNSPTANVCDLSVNACIPKADVCDMNSGKMCLGMTDPRFCLESDNKRCVPECRENYVLTSGNVCKKISVRVTYLSCDNGGDISKYVQDIPWSPSNSLEVDCLSYCLSSGVSGAVAAKCTVELYFL
jgi:hypothetical protein